MWLVAPRRANLAAERRATIMPIIRATISSTLPSDPDRKTRAAIKEATAATAALHHERHLPWHFEPFAAAKYGYTPRSKQYTKRKLQAGRGNKPLVYTGLTKSEILSSRQIRSTGSRGATLILKATLEGITSGKFLKIEDVNRLLAGLRQDSARRKKMERLQARMAKLRDMTDQQKQMARRHSEITAIAPDELNHLMKHEEATFYRLFLKPEPKRSRGADGRFI